MKLAAGLAMAVLLGAVGIDVLVGGELVLIERVLLAILAIGEGAAYLAWALTPETPPYRGRGY